MLISYKYRFLFIHIEKAAGSSVKKALKSYSYSPNLIYKYLRKIGLNSIYPKNKLMISDQHIGAYEVKKEIPQDVWDRLFKFTFTRNPWSLELSRYFFYINLKEWDPEDPRTIAANSAGSFEAYLDWRKDQPYKKQINYILDDKGKSLINFVGRVETIADDFKYVINTIGVEAELTHENTFNLKEFRSSLDYKDYYTPRTRALVEELCREDITLLDYNFENKHLKCVVI
jgi:hypothetical protein